MARRGAQCSSSDGLSMDAESELDLEVGNLHISRPSSSTKSRSTRSKSVSGSKDKKNKTTGPGQSGCKDDTWRFSSRAESRELPSCTSEWDIVDLESIGVYYQDKPVTVSTIMDMVYEQTGMFESLTPEQVEMLKTLQNALTFSFTIFEMLIYSVQDLGHETLLEGIKKDVKPRESGR